MEKDDYPLKAFPVPENEKQRLRALRNYGILDTPAEFEFDRITELASIVCDTPISQITLVDENRQWFKSSKGLDGGETPRELAFCGYTILNDAYFEVEDATKDERFTDNALVTGAPNIRFYAGYPLMDPNGYALGSLCVIDREPKVLTEKQKRALNLLAQEVTSLIVDRRLREELRSFEKLFKLSNDLVFIGGIDGYFRKINPAFTKILGWSEEHILTTSSFEFYHPDDIENTATELRKLADGRATVNFLQRFKTSTGDYKTIQWTSTPEPASGSIFGIGRDVSELILKERQLVLSEEKLRTFFENSQGLMCTHDLEGNFISVNGAGASMLGYSADEIIKLSLFEIIPQARHEFLRQYLKEIKLNGKAHGQMVTRHKDGSTRIWIYNNSLQNDIASEPYVIGNGVDITDRHYLEQTLKRTSQMLEQTNQVARVGGWEYDVIRNKMFWTSVTKEIHGVPADYEPQAATSLDFYKEGESREKLTAAFNKALSEGVFYDEELQMIKADGDEIWVRAIGNAEFEHGRCTRLYGTFQDIDAYKHGELALKRSIETQERLNQALFDHILLIEEQDKTIEKIQEFKFLADSIPQIVWTSKPDGILEYINKHWLEYTGLSEEETYESGSARALHPDDLEPDGKKWKKALHTGKPYQAEVRFKRATDGTYRWHLGQARAMKDERGRIVKWFGSYIDVDEYKRALDLENKISQFEDFNRIVAHNLRGPAGSIHMILEMLSDAESEVEKEDYLGMLKLSSSTLIETLNELMKVLEVRNNKDLAYDFCNFESVVKGVEAMLKGQMVAKKATIKTDFKIAAMEFPKMYLESIFYNMISNSLKYSKPDVPPEINITSAVEHGQIILTFSDNGLGIDMARHGKDVFKLNKVFHSGFDSKGVGLFMTKTQIETFGGRISVTSEPNAGATFTIEFK